MTDFSHALASILGPEPDESPRTTSVAEVTAHTAKRKEWTRKKEKFEDKCAELNRWVEQNVDENAFAITEHCITIRETIRALHARYAGDPVTLRSLSHSPSFTGWASYRTSLVMTAT